MSEFTKIDISEINQIFDYIYQYDHQQEILHISVWVIISFLISLIKKYTLLAAKIKFQFSEDEDSDSDESLHDNTGVEEADSAPQAVSFLNESGWVYLFLQIDLFINSDIYYISRYICKRKFVFVMKKNVK